MTTYKYKGLSPDGAKLSGVIKAYNEFEAVAQLRETCSVITKIEEVKETQSWNKQIGTKKIKDKELAIICSQFAIILTSGLPIVRCVEMVAAQARTKELQRMLKKVAEDVSGGYSLAQSFENNATGFPTTFIETVRAGEQSGTLEACFEKLHKYYDKTAKMKAKIISTLTYPAIVICVTDSNLNHTGIYLYSKGKIMIHLTFDYQSDEGCTTPGQYLRYHRTFQGLTTRELAEKVGVVPATLVLYENDRHPIKHSTAVALANVLGIDRSRLLDEYTVFVDYPYSSLLKKVRRELSFTQMQMAEVIGIGQTTYSGWEREVRVPRRKEHEKILAAMKKLKVDVDTYLCQPNPL